MNAAAAVESDEDLNRSPEGNIVPSSSSAKKTGNIVEFDEDPVIKGGRMDRPQHEHPLQHLGGIGVDGADLKRPGNKLPPLETKSQAFDMVNPQPRQTVHSQLPQKQNQQQP